MSVPTSADGGATLVLATSVSGDCPIVIGIFTTVEKAKATCADWSSRRASALHWRFEGATEMAYGEHGGWPLMELQPITVDEVL